MLEYPSNVAWHFQGLNICSRLQLFVTALTEEMQRQDRNAIVEYSNMKSQTDLGLIQSEQLSLSMVKPKLSRQNTFIVKMEVSLQETIFPNTQS